MTTERLSLPPARRCIASAAALALLAIGTTPLRAAEPSAEAPVGAARPSNAQPSAVAPSAAQKETARTWLREGYEALERGQYASALERFTGAYRLVRVPTTGLAVAQAQERLGQWVEANATAMDVLNMARQPEEPQVFGRARDDARALSDRLSRLIPSLRVEVAPDDAPARVSIDGVEMHGVANGMPFRLNPGEHQLQVGAPGYLTAERSLALHEGSHEQLTIELAADPYAAPTEAAAAAAPYPSATDDASGSAARTRGYIGLGVAGVATLVGGVTGALAFGSKPECPDNRCTPDQKGDADTSKLYGNVATISFGVAALAGAYALWELLANAPAEPPPPDIARASVVPTRSGALLELSGSF